MASDGWIPEIVVGIDFGMTCTGVSAHMEGTTLAAILGLLNVGAASRRCVLHGPGLGRAKDPPALAREDD